MNQDVNIEEVQDVNIEEVIRKIKEVRIDSCASSVLILVIQVFMRIV